MTIGLAHLASRDRAFARQYQGGESLREIAAQHGVTLERVRQVLVRDGVPLRARGYGAGSPPAQRLRLAGAR